MQGTAADYRRLTDRDHAGAVMGTHAIRDLAGYAPRAGFRHVAPDDTEMFELVALHRDVVLLLYRARDFRAQRMLQAVGPGHWVHVQFCVHGPNTETLAAPTETLETRPGTFTVTSYADSTAVTRELAASPLHTTACLYARGRMLERFFRIPHDAWPREVAWLTGAGAHGVQALQGPMDARCYAIVDDMLGCGYRGAARFAFMQARSAELVAALLHAFVDAPLGGRAGSVAPAVRARVERVKQWIDASRGVTDSLAELGARAGLGRSRLAEAFRETFGATVQAYARDVRLTHAYELLRTGELSVSAVAERAGYAELSSFTRAFTAKFGLPPRHVQRGPAAVRTHDVCS